MRLTCRCVRHVRLTVDTGAPALERQVVAGMERLRPCYRREMATDPAIELRGGRAGPQAHDAQRHHGPLSKRGGPVLEVPDRDMGGAGAIRSAAGLLRPRFGKA